MKRAPQPFSETVRSAVTKHNGGVHTDKKYEQIIGLPHHVSESHTPMPLTDRAAQFSPFAALTGYDDCVTEAARLTDSILVSDDDTKALLDSQIALLCERAGERPVITVRYFVHDRRKSGGRYDEKTGELRRVDTYRARLIFTDTQEIPLSDINSISGSIFGDLQ